MSPRAFFAMAGFRTLLCTRFAAQFSDGMFRAGLAGAVLFNPERGADPLTIAGGFAVLLLPYSFIGPFAGALLDRWDRRRVLIVANLLRGTAIVATAVSVGLGFAGLELFVLALIVEGISRFVGSGLSASLPHVVPPGTLVTANAVATTLGSLVAVLGGGVAIGLRSLIGAGNTGSGWTTAVAVLGTLVSAAIARRFARGALGPDTVDEPSDAVLAVARGLVDGARAALGAPSVVAGFVALLAHRASYGISLLITVLLLRFTFTDHGLLKAGLPGLGQLAAMAGAGILFAGFLTPRLVRKLGRRRAIPGALVVAAVAQAGLGLPMQLPTVLVASFVITAAGQVVKLCVDSSIQHDVRDEARGRVFSLYDTLFNITQVIAVSLAATIVPLTGRSVPLLLVATALYLLGAAGYLVIARRARTE
ncbi:MFS transporter [Amycolatopsis thermoflava]|uniref:MFS transporter n=2 Tax=Amycolatopsis thermoflava TaxID=84480 RepID=A0A3N2GWR7_9PSEU|nr:MFS transporter [Amycolatopsis thermoflava]